MNILLRSHGFIPIIRSTLRVPSAKYATHPFKFMEVEDRWREKDGIPRNYNLIYKAPMDNVLNYLTSYITVSTSIIAVAGVYYALTADKSELDRPIVVGGDVVLAHSSIEGLIYVIAFISFHTALKILLSRFVVRLYQDDENYTAVFRGHVHNSIKKYSFHMDDFKRLNLPLVVSWADARFSLGGKHAILLENYFKTPEHFYQLLYKRKLTVNPDEDKS